MNNKRVAIIGAGELGQQIAHLGLKNGYNIVGFFDDYLADQPHSSLPVFGKIDSIESFSGSFDVLVMAIGYAHFQERKSIYEKWKSKFPFISIIDKTAIIDPTATIGEGCVIYPNVVIDKEACINENVVLNLSCNVCHNAVIGSHSYISPAVTLLGYVSIGECVFIGAGAIVKEYILISDDVTIGAQAYVNRPINDTGGGIRRCSVAEIKIKRRVVVFGATGTVGAYAALALKKDGYDVLAVGKRKSDNGFFAGHGIKYISIDITQKEEFDKLPDEVYAVVHLAGAVPARMEGYHPQKYIDTIITGTLNVLNYCQAAKADRIIFAQSISDVAYLCKNNAVIDADAPRRFPTNNDHSIYSICKNAAVDMIEHYYVKFGLKRYILRFPNIYVFHPNPFYYLNGEKRWQSYRFLIEKAKRGEDIELWGNPELKRDIVYVKDCAQIISKSVSTSATGGMYNVGTGKGTTMREQIEGIVEVFSPKEKQSEIILRPDKPDSISYIMDVTKTIEELGYNPEYDYISYLQDMKQEMELEPFSLLWGSASEYMGS